MNTYQHDTRNFEGGSSDKQNSNKASSSDDSNDSDP